MKFQHDPNSKCHLFLLHGCSVAVHPEPKSLGGQVFVSEAMTKWKNQETKNWLIRNLRSDFLIQNGPYCYIPEYGALPTANFRSTSNLEISYEPLGGLTLNSSAVDQIQIGSGFNGVPGSVSGSGFAILIRIRIRRAKWPKNRKS